MSPEQIAGRMRLEQLSEATSHEVIYRFTYDSSRGRSKKLHKRLWRSKSRRGYRGPKLPRANCIPSMRSVPGCQTRFARAAERLDRSTAAAAAAQTRLLAELTPSARRSVTYDQGSEFAGHERWRKPAF